MLVRSPAENNANDFAPGATTCYTKNQMVHKTAARKESTDTKDVSGPAQQTFAATLLNLTWQLAIVIIGPVWLGNWLDNRYGTHQFWTLAGVVLAMLLAITSIYIAYKALQEAQAK